MKYVVQFIVVNENQWVGNSMVYDTREEAAEAGTSKAHAWTAVEAMRVVPEGTPRDTFDPSDPNIVINLRRGQ